MRMSDWSSDVCSSDLGGGGGGEGGIEQGRFRRDGRAAPEHGRRAGVAEIAVRRPREGGGRWRFTLSSRGKADSGPRLRGGDGFLPDPIRHHVPAIGVHQNRPVARRKGALVAIVARADRSEEHTSELQSIMRISYAVFCL